MPGRGRANRYSRNTGQAVPDALAAYDRALRLLKPGYKRVHLDEIGFMPDEIDCPWMDLPLMSPLSIEASHLHGVARMCAAMGATQPLGRHVDLAEIPSDHLQEVLNAIHAACEAEPLMPGFTPNIKYVCISQVHFVYAHKLAKEGSRTLYNDGLSPIKWLESDWDGANILEDRPVCAIYDSSLLLDIEAAMALAMRHNSNHERFTASQVGWELVARRLDLVESAMSGEDGEDTRATIDFVKKRLAERLRPLISPPDGRAPWRAPDDEAEMYRKPFDPSSKHIKLSPLMAHRANASSKLISQSGISNTEGRIEHCEYRFCFTQPCGHYSCKYMQTLSFLQSQEAHVIDAEGVEMHRRKMLQEYEHKLIFGEAPNDVEMLSVNRHVQEAAIHGMAPGEHGMAPAEHELSQTTQHLQILADQFRGMNIGTPKSMPAAMLEQHTTYKDPVAEHDLYAKMRETRPTKPKDHTPKGKLWEQALRAQASQPPKDHTLTALALEAPREKISFRRRYTKITAKSSGIHGDADMPPNAGLMFKGLQARRQYDTTQPTQAQSSSSDLGSQGAAPPQQDTVQESSTTAGLRTYGEYNSYDSCDGSS